MILSFIIIFITKAYCWQKYATPLTLAKPNEDGVYEFDLVVTHKLTMSSEIEYGHVQIVDFDPEKGKWSVRSSDQLAPCNAAVDATPNGNTSINFDSLLQLHGLHQRVTAINGKSPGDTIVVPYGAEVVMRVHNRLLTEGITLHVHGLDKRNMWYMDGVAFVQQCPIAVGSSFAYRFIADVPGTHWYHGHMMQDRGEGLLGGFVVKKRDETIPLLDGTRAKPNREYNVILQDWPIPEQKETWYCHIQETMKWLYGFDNRAERCWAPTRIYDGSNLGGSVPISALLINDKGWHDQAVIKKNPEKLLLETFRITKDEKILLRVVNGGVAQELMVTVEEHPLTIVAADGAEIQPVKVDSLIIFPGERYDVLINGLSSPKRKTYRIIVETLEVFDWDWKKMNPFYGIANLEYEDDGLLETNGPADLKHSACTQKRKCVVLNCPFKEFASSYNLTCKNADELLNGEGIRDTEVVSEGAFTSNFEETFINMHYDSHVNGWKFELPKGIPYYYEGRQTKISQWCDPERCPVRASQFDPKCRCFYHLNMTLNSIIQLTVYNMGDGGAYGNGYSHPLHLHGTHFYLMKIGYGSYNNETGAIIAMNRDIPCTSVNDQCNNLKWTDQSWLGGKVKGMNTKNPPSRDTVVIPVGGYIIIRFRATNPGWFFAHCHLMLHNMGGTAFAYKVGDHDQMPVPPADFPHDCGIFEPPPIRNWKKTLPNEKVIWM